LLASSFGCVFVSAAWLAAMKGGWTRLPCLVDRLVFSMQPIYCQGTLVTLRRKPVTRPVVSPAKRSTLACHAQWAMGGSDNIHMEWSLSSLTVSSVGASGRSYIHLCHSSTLSELSASQANVTRSVGWTYWLLQPKVFLASLLCRRCCLSLPCLID
jgi:hypothetical protein